MASRNSTTPTVRIARVAGRPLQLWYRDSSGRKVRKSTGTHDAQEAERQRRELEARLILELPQTQSGAIAGPSMSWSDFREAYRQARQYHLRPKSLQDAESRLDLAERILRPRTLQDVADRLDELQDGLLRGVASVHKRPRATSTVNTHVSAVVAALNWAARPPRRWLESVPRVEPVRLEDSDDMKGRPLVGEEVDRLFSAVVKVVGEQAAPSWQYLLRGVLASGLRLGELLNVSWDIPQTIQPIWGRGRRPVLAFPAARQKNKRREETPLCPWLEQLLLETPEADRTGWIFDPASLLVKRGRAYHGERLSLSAVGRVISRIGRRAGIIVDQGNQRTGSPPKYASCHDLRRTFATRLHESNLAPELIRTLMRHSDLKTTERYYLSYNTQTQAGRIADALAGTQVTLCDPDGEQTAVGGYPHGRQPVKK